MISAETSKADSSAGPKFPVWAMYAIPIAACLALHWNALYTWFFADDFAWLWMTPKTHHFHDLITNLFYPMAEGTLRVLSERLFFMVYEWIFGLNATPYHITVMATQLASVALLAWIARRLTGSTLAGMLAPVFWCANPGIMKSLAWISAYNQVLCSFFLLAAFACLLRYIDTQDERWWRYQWVAFLLGFGALELTVIYPVIAASYAWLSPRRDSRALFRRTLSLFIGSAAFLVFHFILRTWAIYQSPAHGPVYSMFLDGDLPKTLWWYLSLALAARRPEHQTLFSAEWRSAIAIVLTLALLWFAILKARRGNRLGIFCLAWFIALLAPMIPFKNHLTDYYLTIPAIGLAILAAWGVSATFQHGSRYALVVLLLPAVYLSLGCTDVWTGHLYYRESSMLIKRVLLGVGSAWRDDPKPVVFLSGVDDSVFWMGLPHRPLERLIGIPAVYLTPGSEDLIQPHPEWASLAPFAAAADMAFQALHSSRAVVFDVAGGAVTNVTARYQEIATAGYLALHRRIVDAGDPTYASRLTDGWYPPEHGHRWMGKSATVEIGGPEHSGQSLFVSGFLPALLAAGGPVQLTVSVDGANLGTVTPREADKPFEAAFALPPSAIGKYAMTIELRVNRTARFGADPRELGLPFTKFEVR
ncbi:MAG TPA: hypothetical protein VN610_10395 [Bryobacteraceae bacterium]|nr:hypothetical protein [Bryobacteraceae bacterium]